MAFNAGYNFVTKMAEPLMMVLFEIGYIGFLIFLAAYSLLWDWVEARFFRKNKNEKKRSKIFIVSYVAIIGVAILTPIATESWLTRLHYFHSTLKPLIVTCEEGADAKVCLEVAQQYRHGQNVRCEHYFKYGGSTSSICEVLLRDIEKANIYSKLACDYGSLEGCYEASQIASSIEEREMDPSKVEQAKLLCEQGQFSACNILTKVLEKPSYDPVLPPLAVIENACKAGDETACLYALKYLTIDILEGSELMLDMSKMMQLQTSTMMLNYSTAMTSAQRENFEAIQTLTSTLFSISGDKKTVFANRKRSAEALSLMVLPTIEDP